MTWRRTLTEPFSHHIDNAIDMPPVLLKLSPEELDNYPWVVLRFSTTGLVGGVNCNQQFDFSEACPTCGTGAQPVPALVVNLNKMGRKQLDRTAHDGHLVISADLAAVLNVSGLDGFTLSAVQHFSTNQPDPRFFRLRIESQWPRMHPRRILEVEEQCPTCQRSGHFDTYDRASEFWYPEIPSRVCDFNLTWEYFGIWKPHHLSSRTVPVGGSQMPILSRRARMFLLEHKVRHLQFSPIFFDRTKLHLDGSGNG